MIKVILEDEKYGVQEKMSAPGIQLVYFEEGVISKCIREMLHMPSYMILGMVEILTATHRE
ncbi:uncharacterized protein EAE97_007662 [Botrytis byssoidea]|uniref:Uncharacterized protein n=1 Tax=Botrytis byssoidea TaxID=139641 RepID=A0A9P5ID48_9HELO|nr:uncharacterized protein EAE97_007662 [Botrytis byssoidea]KAF7937866.1 hypothetical protein EAE97_007662 [Botrytis byssoidea]